MNKPQVSLVIPIRNEEASIERLIDSIARQTLAPDEIVLVDGGSTDRTVEIVERIAAGDARFRLIRTDGATPGKGRNIGIEAASFEVIALTDAGIMLEDDWLEILVASLAPSATSPGFEGGNGPDADIVYGNVDPVIDNLFEKCAAIAFVAEKKAKVIRMEFIASCLFKKQVWRKVGGFPDLRAAEDLMFMEAVEAAGFRASIAPDAMVHWQLQPDVLSTLQKFILYSKHNVWAGRQWDWHYGIVRLYVALVPFVVLAAVHSR
ncbi:MAG: glycosyltransferase, partial [Acidobacteriota bacterium]